MQQIQIDIQFTRHFRFTIKSCPTLEMSSHKYKPQPPRYNDLIVAKLVHVDTARYRDRCSRMDIVGNQLTSKR